MRDKKQEKTYVEDVSRSVYDIRNEEKDVYRVDEGLTEAIVSQISKEKNDPAWMQNFRLDCITEQPKIRSKCSCIARYRS